MHLYFGKSSIPKLFLTVRRVIHKIIIPENPFLEPVPAWLRDFRSSEPCSLTTIPPSLLCQKPRTDVIHRVVTWYKASLRAGTASTKHRSDVRGSGRKIYQQKGLGRARAGSNRAPQRRGGARCFGPKPRNFSFTLPPKIRNLGLRSALTAKFNRGQLSFIVAKTLSLEATKTSELLKIIDRFTRGKLLVVDVCGPSRCLDLSSRSLSHRYKHIDIKNGELNACHIMNADFVLISDRAKEVLSGRIKRQ